MQASSALSKDIKSSVKGFKEILCVTSMILMRAFQIMLNFKEASSILLFSLLLSKLLDFESSSLYTLLVGLDLLIPSGASKHKTIPFEKKYEHPGFCDKLIE